MAVWERRKRKKQRKMIEKKIRDKEQIGWEKKGNKKKK